MCQSAERENRIFACWRNFARRFCGRASTTSHRTSALALFLVSPNQITHSIYTLCAIGSGADKGAARSPVFGVGCTSSLRGDRGCISLQDLAIHRPCVCPTAAAVPPTCLRNMARMQSLVAALALAALVTIGLGDDPYRGESCAADGACQEGGSSPEGSQQSDGQDVVPAWALTSDGSGAFVQEGNADGEGGFYEDDEGEYDDEEGEEGGGYGYEGHPWGEEGGSGGLYEPESDGIRTGRGAAPHSHPLVAVTAPDGDIEWVSRYINRELSWLSFNERVLSEASSMRHPLLERLRFLSISHSNLDEFITVRIAGLKQLASSSVQSLSADGLNPAQQLSSIYGALTDIQSAQQDLWVRLREQIAEQAGIVIVDVADLPDNQREWVKNFFLDEMWPQLSPQSLDPAHPFPFIPGKGMGLLLTLSHLPNSQSGRKRGGGKRMSSKGSKQAGTNGGATNGAAEAAGAAPDAAPAAEGASEQQHQQQPPSPATEHSKTKKSKKRGGSKSRDLSGASGDSNGASHSSSSSSTPADAQRKRDQPGASLHLPAEMRVIIPFPPTLPRFIRLPDLGNGGNGGSAGSSVGSASSKASAAGVKYSTRASNGNGNGYNGGSSHNGSAAGTAQPTAPAAAPAGGAAAAGATAGNGAASTAAVPPIQPPLVRFVLAEDAIKTFLGSFFPNFRVREVGTFRLLRDSEVEIDEEAIDLVRMFESALKRRRKGVVIHVAVDSNMPPEMVSFLSKNVDLPREQVSQVGLVGLADVKQLIVSDHRARFLFRPFTARFPPRIADHGGDVLAAIRAKDIVVHHPYESFDVVLQFVRQAARDPNVVAIKQTLYRTSDDSPIVRELIHASESGKTVTALIELKARFDEEANIRWARDMQRAGVQVVYGFVELKTHAKVALVVRREDGGLRSYIHVGTGNYHPVTAKIYTDVSFFSADPVLCRDAAKLFNYMTGYGKVRLCLVTAGRRRRDAGEGNRPLPHLLTSSCVCHSFPPPPIGHFLLAAQRHGVDRNVAPLPARAARVPRAQGDRQRARRAPGPDLGQDERACRHANHRPAVRGQRGGRPGRPHCARHVRAAPGRPGPVEPDPRPLHHRPVSRALAHLRLRTRLPHALRPRRRLHLERGLDDPEPRLARGGLRSPDQPYSAQAGSERDPRAQPRGHRELLVAYAERGVPPRPRGRRAAHAGRGGIPRGGRGLPPLLHDPRVPVGEGDGVGRGDGAECEAEAGRGRHLRRCVLMLMTLMLFSRWLGVCACEHLDICEKWRDGERAYLMVLTLHGSASLFP
jgi:hypothetical protein